MIEDCSFVPKKTATQICPEDRKWITKGKNKNNEPDAQIHNTTSDYPNIYQVLRL